MQPTRLHSIEHALLKFLVSLATDSADPSQKKMVIVVLVSGGHDSMCLLHALRSVSLSHLLPAWLSLHIEVVHCNHQKRGEESDLDEAFVEATCGDMGITCHIHRLSDMSDDERRIIVEGNFQNEARRWRDSRAQMLRERLMMEQQANVGWVTTAHHARDNVESILLHLIRGTGPSGLCGIRMCSPEQKLIRPFAQTPFPMLQAYARASGVVYREDSSNAECEYSRNLVRNRIIPEIARLNPNYEAGFLRTAENMSDLIQRVQPVQAEILPITPDLSTGDIVRFAASVGQELSHEISSNVARNILVHARKYQAELMAQPHRLLRIPLRGGWSAVASRQGIRFEKLT